MEDKCPLQLSMLNGQKGVTRAGLTCYPQKCHLQSWLLDFRRVPTTLTDEKWLTAPKLQVHHMAYAEHLHHFQESAIWYMLDRGCLCDQPPMKTLDIQMLMSFPGRQHFTKAAIICWENQEPLVKLHWKKTLRSLYQVSSTLHPMCLFSLLFALYSFVLINHSHEYNYMLNPSRKSSNLRVVLRTPNTVKGRSQNRT